MKVVGVIPARMASTRFPGKPLAPILGIPMVEHVYRRSAMSGSLDRVYVATCDDEIARAVEGFGGEAVMTAACHERCTDRVAEAMESREGDIVVIIQGDEPMVRPEMIDQAVAPMLADPALECVNLMAEIRDPRDFHDPNEVKVVCDRQGFALYFSREAIPSEKKYGNPVTGHKQVCIMPFRRDFLFTYTRLPPTPLEIIESVDMLRVLEHGYRVRMVLTGYETCSVDTPGDLEYVGQAMKDDPLVRRYAR
ncbi:MAG TPA: 3-deoxy-manno-octulosonate cytidylyltransferase [Methanomicrobiales archaeon]|jgi:3-deoxy-manno-octulosonate cytidylyltransferase (CMP-KDO synthetase)|nr:3-deoxy-manno-octulosonate cytidylyltransferase [Methanomicrobiales archaeon]